MDKRELGKRVLLDAVVDPLTLIPLMIGGSALILSFGMSGPVWLTVGGIFALLGGLGLGSTRLVLSMDERINAAVRKIQVEQVKQRSRVLDSLQARLARDRDGRTREAVQSLRQLYEQYRYDVGRNGFLSDYGDISGKAEELFQACIEQIAQSCKLWESSRKVPERVKRDILEDRGRVIQEIEAAVESLGKTVASIHELTATEGASELSRVREDLDVSLEAARQVESRTARVNRRKENDL